MQQPQQKTQQNKTKPALPVCYWENDEKDAAEGHLRGRTNPFPASCCGDVSQQQSLEGVEKGNKYDEPEFGTNWEIHFTAR